MSKEATGEAGLGKTLALGLMGKVFVKKLNGFVEKGAEDWGVKPEEIVMQMKILNKEPVIRIIETKWYKKALNITEQLGSMERLAKLMFKKLLVSNTHMAKEWGISEEKVRMDLKMIDKKPELRILEEGGQARFIDMEL